VGQLRAPEIGVAAELLTIRRRPRFISRLAPIVAGAVAINPSRRIATKSRTGGLMMKRATIVAVTCVLGFSSAARTAEKGASPKGEAVTVAAADVKFGPAPPSLPAGAQLAVLHGDPGKKGAFAARLRLPDGYKVAPHWHSNDEELTIVSGTFLLSMGDKAGENVQTLAPGAYHFLPAKMHHAAQTKGETVIELHGPGPFDIHYLNPADDPSKKSASNK
jgi:quercetin dioxygenase-like cupin family protein